MPMSFWSAHRRGWYLHANSSLRCEHDLGVWSLATGTDAKADSLESGIHRSCWTDETLAAIEMGVMVSAYAVRNLERQCPG